MTLVVVTTTPVDPLTETRSRMAFKGKETKEAMSAALKLAATESSERRWRIPETANRVVTRKLKIQ